MGVYIGKIIAISELNVQVLINEEKVKYHDILYTEQKGKKLYFEVAEEDGNVVSAISRFRNKKPHCKIKRHSSQTPKTHSELCFL